MHGGYLTLYLSTAFVSTEREAANSELRKAYQDLKNRDEEYFATQCLDPHKLMETLMKNRNVFLTDTFVIIDKTCVDSVLTQPGYTDGMRVVAFETDFPQPNRTYFKGYQGWAWFCLEQLIEHFYRARITEDHGMDMFWKAVQESKNQAFAGLDPKESEVWTTGTSMTGLLPGNILGKHRRSL